LTLGERHGANTFNTKKYIDFVAYTRCFDRRNTVVENWAKKDAFDFITPYEDFNLKEIVSMQNQKM
jgi:alpha-glucosidase